MAASCLLMKTLANSTVVEGTPVSCIPEAINGRGVCFLHNVSPIVVKYGFEPQTSWSGMNEGLPLQPGDWRNLGGHGVDLRGPIYLITDNLSDPITGDFANNANVITNVISANAFLLAGMIIQGPGIPEGTVILEVAGGGITLSQFTTSDGEGVNFTISAPVVFTQR